MQFFIKSVRLNFDIKKQLKNTFKIEKGKGEGHEMVFTFFIFEFFCRLYKPPSPNNKSKLAER